MNKKIAAEAAKLIPNYTTNERRISMHVHPIMQSALNSIAPQKYKVRCQYKILNQNIVVLAVSEYGAIQNAKAEFARLNPPVKRNEVRVLGVDAV
jgi:hypothetical protein